MSFRIQKRIRILPSILQILENQKFFVFTSQKLPFTFLCLFRRQYIDIFWKKAKFRFTFSWKWQLIQIRKMMPIRANPDPQLFYLPSCPCIPNFEKKYFRLPAPSPLKITSSETGKSQTMDLTEFILRTGIRSDLLLFWLVFSLFWIVDTVYSQACGCTEYPIVIQMTSLVPHLCQDCVLQIWHQRIVV